MRMFRLIAFAASSLVAATPSAAHDVAELHSFHCLHGCPAGTPQTSDIVVREIYTLASNDITKMADWVAYRVTPDTIGPSGDRNWAPDPWLSDEETLEPDDYDGAAAALGIDRGHQAPLAAFSGTPFKQQTNILSNITPQGSGINQAPWQRLEARENELARRENIAVYVVTGPLFERMMPPLPRANERHWLKQIWFAGNHSDIGGSYPEEQSRLSDVALEWMVDELKGVMGANIQIVSDRLVTSPDALALQHSERTAMLDAQPSWFRRMTRDRVTWSWQIRKIPEEAYLHPTVPVRLAASAVPQMGEVKPYRPEAIRSHELAQKYYR